MDVSSMVDCEDVVDEEVWILKSSELICRHGCYWMICWLSCYVVRLPPMIWGWSSWTWFWSQPALLYWVTFTTTMGTYLTTFSLSPLTLTPRPGWWGTWPCGPLTFPLCLCLSFWSFFPSDDSDSGVSPCLLIILLTSLSSPFPVYLLDSLNPPWRPSLRCQIRRSTLRECCWWSSWWGGCGSHSTLTSRWCWGKEHWQGAL